MGMLFYVATTQMFSNSDAVELFINERVMFM